MSASSSVYLIEPENIPSPLRERDQWLCWRGVWDETKQKLNKVPKSVDGTAASSTNEETWTTLDKALHAVDGSRLHGIGFAGMERTPFAGIDIDHCIDPETGEISPYAMKLVREFDSYTERTVSGTGLRIWIEAEKAPGSWCGSKNEDRELEVYSRGRFFTVTGLHLDGTPKTIERRQEAFDTFMEREAPPEKPKPSRTAYNGPADFRLELDEFLQESGVMILRQVNDQTSEQAYAIVCPWAHEHTGGDTSGTRVGQYPSGALWFKCDHAHCDGRVWEHFRQHLDPEAYKTVPINLNGHKKTDDSKTSDKPATPTHDELRDRFLTTHEDYAFGLGEWQHYSYGAWSHVPEAKVKGLVSKVVEAGKPEGVKPTASIVNSVSELTKYRAFVDDDLWDADPDILVCGNGTLHIPTGELRSHDRGHYATNAVPYDFDPEAKAPAWRFLLAGTVPEAADFLQEFAGYALTTDTLHEIALWLYGPPGSGRSTFLTGLEAMLGPRAGILGLADLERSQFALANVAGKTLMTATEQPSSYLASTNVLNALISGETIQVERKFRDPYEITPRAKLAWAMNELPRVGDANSGIFRRVKVVSFPAMASEDRDPEIKERIKDEGPGILNWAREGLTRLRDRGRFEIPEGVEDATAQFKNNNDVPALFVADKCVKEADAKEKASELYKEYKFWCEENGHRPQSSTRLSDEWQRLGFERYRAKGSTYYRGVRMRLPGE